MNTESQQRMSVDDLLPIKILLVRREATHYQSILDCDGINSLAVKSFQIIHNQNNFVSSFSSRLFHNNYARSELEVEIFDFSQTTMNQLTDWAFGTKHFRDGELTTVDTNGKLNKSFFRGLVLKQFTENMSLNGTCSATLRFEF